MKNKINERDKRALKLGAIAVVVVLLCVGIGRLFKEYSVTKKALVSVQAQVEQVMGDKDGKLSHQQRGLLSIVPRLEIPEQEEIPGAKFRQKFSEQLKKAGIKYTQLAFLSASKSRNALGFKTLKLQCKGKCKFNQAIDLLEKLYDNPLFVAVEELKLECDPKKRTEMRISIVVSTFVK